MMLLAQLLTLHHLASTHSTHHCQAASHRQHPLPLSNGHRV
jgi:hypothetical protein